MRGKPDYQSQSYYPIDIESWIVADHPLRAVKRRAAEVLSAMRRDFEKAYAKVGRPLDLNLLYKWFIDLSLDAPAWNAR